MKNFKTLLLALMMVTFMVPVSILAQEEEEESSASIDAGMDIYSSYIWRGAKFGSGPAFQPWVEGAIGNLVIGAWGSVNASIDEALEMDLYIGYSFDFGLSIGVTDYYFGHIDGDSIGFEDGETVYEQLGFFAYDEAHYIEPNIALEVGDFSAMAAYMFVPGFDEGDIYLQAGYSFGALDITLGAGDGAYTDDGEFMLCNITIGTSKEIAITEKFSLPISGGVTLNPSTEGFFIYAGISF
ncbi:MAG: hypothetical protein PVF73_08865 [Bacteroidales bacterium]|jgi:hypothetical protein